MVKSFLQYLNESFFTGEKTPLGYVEIFKNPTSKEILTVSRQGDGEMGMWLTDRDAYLWDRLRGTHSNVRYFIPDLDSDSIPIYLYRKNDRTVQVQLAEYTAHPDAPYGPELVTYCQSHPAFRGLTVLEMR